MTDENAAGATLTAVTTENATSTTVDDERFEIADGNLKLKDDMSLDFEGGDGGSVDVVITASGDGDSATHTVTVTINDLNEAPTIDVRDNEVVPVKDVNTSLTIDENTVHDGKGGPPLALIEVMDADADDPTTHQEGADRVTLTGDHADYFQVILDPENGLWLAMTEGATFDFEDVGGSVMVTVTYTDGDGLAVEKEVTVTVNDVNEAAMVGEVGVPDAVFVGGQMNETEVDLKALFSDPDGDGLNYRLSDNAPDWLEFSVTFKGSGEEQTITGKLSGTAPESDITAVDVSIIATDGGGLEAHAMFDVVVDEENDAPTRLELRVTDDEGVTERVTTVNVEENAMGAVLGNLVLDDPDDARHPHGQHEYSFMVDGEPDTVRFEVTDDGMLKLTDVASLNHEDGAEVELTVTATDMMVGELEEGEDATTESISRVITITVGDVDTGTTEGPTLVKDAEVEDVTITVHEDLEEDDVDEGDWLETIPTGLSKAFDDEDGDTLTYSLASGAPRWLQIDEETGQLTNKELMLVNRGVYDITIVASDDDGNTAEVSIVIAVAISDSGDEDNDEPDIRNVSEYDYEEGSGGGKVASFEVRDEDIEIAPHPYGVLKVEFTATQEGDGPDKDVTNAFKIVKVGDDGDDTASYEIHAKTDAELAEGADGDDKDDDPDEDKEGNVIPVPAIDYEEGDEIDFEVTVTDMDGKGEEDDRGISIDLDDAADESPEFQVSAVEGGTRVKDTSTTTVKVAQETTAATVVVLHLSDVWDDADTDDDDLDFDVDGTSDLPDWIKVYGPDRWEDIYEDEDDVAETDAPDLRDRDEVVVIVMDRTAASENVSLEGGSFTITADDGDGNMATETIMLSVSNTNVDPADATKVVSISGGDPNDDKEVTGTGDLTMSVDFSLDPDLKGGEHPYLVLYTWMVSTDIEDSDAMTVEDESVTTIMVSASAQPLPLGEETTPGMMARIGAYVDQTITAKVEIFEVDGATGKITKAQEYTATVDTASAADAPVMPPAATSVTFGDLLTDATGLSLNITATGEAAEAGTARLEVSTDGSTGWITVDTTAADTSGEDGSADITLDVDADGSDATEGDGGGLHYRVVYVYEGKDGDAADDADNVEVASDVIQLGSVTDPAGTTGLIAPASPASGDTVRVDTGTADVDVQWQMQNAMMEWMDLADETGKTLSLTDGQAGRMVRAKVTYMGDDENPDHVTWVEYSALANVAVLSTAANNAPARTQGVYEIRVNLNSDDDEGTGTGSVAGLFFDADSDDLTYTLVGDQVDDGANGVQPGGTVFRSADDDQVLTINSDSGNITYYTNNGTSHDNDANDSDGDGAGNIFTVMVQATDDAMPAATSDEDLTVNVRVNVAPTAIHNQNGDALQSDAKMTATPSNETFAETADHAGGNSVTLDVQDINLNTDSFGTHDLKVDDSRFEVARVDDTDMSMWTLSVKEGAEFDYEHKDNPMGVVTVKVTATDKGGKKTEGYISFQLTDEGDASDDGVGNENTGDPQYVEDDTSGVGGSGGIMTAGAGAGNDDNGVGNAPGDGGAFIDVDDVHVLNIEADDLLDSYVLAIDDIDVA